MFARKYPEAFAANSQYYFREEASSLLKLLNNGKRIISDMAHEGITGILNHVCLPKIIDILATLFRNNKNTLVRQRTASYFEDILEKYSIEILSKNAKGIENDFLKPALLD